MVPPADPALLVTAIAAALDDPARAKAGAARLRERIGALFSQDAMVQGILAGYGEAIGRKFKQSH
jgi:glycosyltransferase involved in cell wall biosynthesis